MNVRALTVAAMLLLASSAPRALETHSANYRLVGPGSASISAQVASPAYSLFVVGGAGQPVGISASAATSVVTGGTSTALPTNRVFRDGLEP